MKELTLSEIKNMDIRNIDKVNLAIEFANEVSKFYPCEPLFYVHESYPNYIDYVGYILKNEKCRIKIKYLNFGGKSSRNEYMIYLDENFKYIDDYSKKRIFENFQTPNKIHKLNEKSIRKWVDFLNKVYDYLSKLDLERIEKVNQFLNKIKDENIKWIDENRKGVIRKNGIEFFFEVNSNGTIYQKIGIALSEVLPNYENFKLLSDNKFSNEKR